MISELLAIALFLPLEAPQNPLITEFVAANQSDFEDEDGDSSDWLEVHNTGPGSLDLGGYYLTDDPNQLTKWAFPSPTPLAAGSSVVVFASDKDRAVSGQELHTNFKLTSNGEYLAVVMPNGTTVVHEYSPEYPQQYSDRSYGLRFQPGPTLLESYFPVPTPGQPNSFGGPFVAEAEHSPLFPTDVDDIVVEAEVLGASVPIATVSLTYRVDFGGSTTISMHDDGIAPDQQAGDGVWTAAIPAGTASPGEMVRWQVLAQDTNSLAGKAPLNLISESAEYFGTVVQDPAVISDIPTMYWFVQNPSQAETRSGTRCSLWYNGEFYDNQFCRIRGGSTSSYTKKSYKIDFNPGEKFRWQDGVSRMEEINLNSTWSDKSYIRQHLSWEMYHAVGAHASLSGMVHLRQNGGHHGLYNFVEQVDDEFLDRIGLDEDGALYKMYNPVNSSTFNVDKKTRTGEGNQDLQDLVNGVQLSGVALDAYLMDNIDLPAVVSYLVATSLIHDNDHVEKNYYLYRDSEGDREWMFLPWDKDLTWGRNFTLFGGVLNDTIWASNDPRSHPLFGDVNHPKVDGPWNRLIDACYRSTRVRAMYARRLWTVMEEQLQAPGTPAQDLLWEQRIAALQAELAPEVALDVQSWGAPSWDTNMTFVQGLNQITQDYLPDRRVHLFQTHLASGVLPGPPSSTPAVVLGAMEADPLSGDDDEEWLELENPTTDAVDLSGWSVSGGIEFTFAPGTVVPAGQSLYLSPELHAFRQRSQSPKGGERLFVVGPYDGNLQANEDLFVWDAEGSLITSNTATFTLFASELKAGESFVLSVAGATPNQFVYLAYSRAGNGPTTTPFGVAELSQPILQLPRLTADASGVASFSSSIPAGAAGLQAWFQALDFSSGLFSNSHARTIR